MLIRERALYRRVLTAVMIAAVLGVVAVMGILPTYAQSANASRSFDSASVAPGGTVTVTITASDYGQAGGVTETLPTGFSYVGSSLASSQATELAGNQVRFTLQGDTSFTYSVTASDTPGSYAFEGMLRDFERDNYTVGGATMVTVTAPPSGPTPSASRSFSPTSVSPGGTVTVTITAADYGQAGGVTETLPTGFSYVGSSLASSQATELAGNQVRFTLQGDTSFTYSVTASDTPGSYAFEGMLRDFERDNYTVGGATMVTVTAPPSGPTPSASRSFSPTSVSPGGTVTVTITAADYGQAGGVTETLPVGFSYVDSSLDSSQVTELDGNQVRFTLQGDTSFTYTVTASETVGTYSFSGTLRDFDRNDLAVGGVNAIRVGSPPSPPSRPSPPSQPSPPTDVTDDDDTCLVDTLSVDGAVSGEWSSSCGSTDQAGSYARYYSFTLTEGSDVTITLESSTDTYLYLRTGAAKSGAYLYENDDVDPGTDTNSEIQATLGAGIYTIEATTYSAGETGSFTLTISGLGGGAVAGPSDDTCLETLLVDRVSGDWSSSCESTAREGSYARYYSFMLTEGSNVTITLESSTDTYLYLRSGEAKSGTAAHENDDVDPGTDTNSEIQATLGAGIYTIEATTYSAGETGSFTLTVSGPGGGAVAGPSDDTCLETLLVDRVIGDWSSSCESTAREGSYARYYSFMLTEGSNVTITLESSTDTYLYLRSGEAKSGTAAHENDDVDPGTDTNSEIQATLGAGIYTIEATTYSAGETGSFTLTVSGPGGGAVAGPSDACLETLLVDRVIGDWSSSCESTAREGSYARYYSFMLTEGSNVTITLESSTDTYLYLRSGEAKSGTAAHENDDVDPGTDTNSEIQATLGAGIYTIEATTYSAGQTGSFTLNVGGL